MRSKSVLFAVAVVLVLAVAAAAFWMRRRGAPASSTQASAIAPAQASTTTAHARKDTLQQRLYLDIQRNGLTPDKARQLFSLVFGDLPGTKMSDADRDPDEFCGTMAATYIHQVWGTLSPAERDAVDKVLGPATPQRVGRVFAPAAHVLLAGFGAPSADVGKYPYLQIAKDVDLDIAKRVNMNPVKFTLDVGLEMPGNGTAKAETDSWKNGKRLDDGCHIHVYDPMFAPLTFDDAVAVMSHEMWHCYQQDAVGQANGFASIHKWLIEGQADWVMATMRPAATVYIKDWTQYVTSPDTVFSDRGQDALGVYGHLTDVSGSDATVWGRLIPVIALGVGGYDKPAFMELTQGYRLPYVTSWGASYFLTSGRQNWTMSGPGQVPGSGVPPTDVTVAEGTEQVLPALGGFQAKALKLSSSADVLAVGLLTGYGRLHDEGFGLDTQLVSGDVVAMCLKKGGCACPDGTPGASLVTKPATAPIALGLEGADMTAMAGVAAKSLDEYCQKPDPPAQPVPPPPPGGDGGGGGGDPEQPPAPHDGGSHETDVHMRTFDGLRYDFQVVGEYTLVRSTVDDWAIQVREVPVLKSRTVSVSQATATKIGSHRVTITLDNGRPVLRVDGTVSTDARVALPGGTIERATTMYGDGFRIEWADGTTARVDQAGASMLNTNVIPSESRRGTLAGLLGNDNGTPSDDLVANGVSLGTQPAADDITHKFADAWRITQETSLFDYSEGQTTASFTDPTFPDAHVDPTRVPDRATAEQRCRQSGVTDPALLANCIVDYGSTSDFLFASVYAREQQMLAARVALPPPNPGILRATVMNGTVADPAAHPSGQFMARAGDVVWIGNPGCTDNYMQARFQTPSGKGLSGSALCAMGRFVLTETGQYTLTAYGNTNPLGPFSIPIRIVRPDRVSDTAYGKVLAGRIETRGAHDVYTFDGHAGDVLRFAGEGCDLGPLVVSLIDPAGHDSLAPNCRADNVMRLQQDGKFRLVINGGDSASGPYHFVFQGVHGS